LRNHKNFGLRKTLNSKGEGNNLQVTGPPPPKSIKRQVASPVLMNSGRCHTVPTLRSARRKIEAHGSGSRDAQHESIRDNLKEGSRMSGLKIYWPESEPAATATESNDADIRAASNEPAIYSFAEWVNKLRSPESNRSALRAQRLNSNQTCPDCTRAGVLPLVLNDGRIDGSGRLVPGSATLVGFRCDSCSHEWAV
jgi:hypothetical protein